MTLELAASLPALPSVCAYDEFYAFTEPPFGLTPNTRFVFWGGSLSLGHPFGATGGRLISTAMKRLEVTGARYAVVSGCAAGGHGSAILIENPAAVH